MKKGNLLNYKEIFTLNSPFLVLFILIKALLGFFFWEAQQELFPSLENFKMLKRSGIFCFLFPDSLDFSSMWLQAH